LGNIIHLPKELVEKIAAGEVIERPVSVVKELIENSIDANADDIKVFVEHGGKRLIKVIDNGKGMNHDDLMVCVKRHSTSKIKSIDDLFNITSLGFRGEALASISAIADITVASKTSGNSTGVRVEYDENGNPKNDVNVSINDGTVITVRNIFSRFPARLKFMKSEEVEFSHIIHLIRNYSLANPNISFHLYRDGKEVFNSPKSNNLLDKIYYVFGREITENLIPIDAHFGNVKINGYISKIGYTKKTKNYQVVFVNDRYVISKEVIDAVYKGNKNKLFLNRHPVIILKLYLPPEDIDVNIHPSKRKIKFKNENELIGMIEQSVNSSLSKNDLTVTVDAEDSLSKPQKAYKPDKTNQKILPLTPITHSEKQMIKPSYSNHSHSPGPFSHIKHQIPELKIIGQVNKTYILAENIDGLFIIDQHASQERVNYERFMKQLKNNALSTQKLLSPVIFEANKTEQLAIIKHIRLLKRYGYDIEEYGPNAYRINTIPVIFNNALPIKLFKDVLDEIISFYDEKRDNSIKLIEEILDNRIATKSCRASIKAGHEMTITEMRDLLNDLSKCDNPFTCPHGRPTIIRIGWGEMEKKFKRTA